MELSGRSTLSEFANSTAYAAFVQPTLGVTQLMDQAAGTKLMSAAINLFDGFGITEPGQADGTVNWHAQQFGSAVGMMLPFLLTHKVVKGGASQLFAAESIAAGAELKFVSAKAFTGLAGREALLSGTTGFLNDAIFRPADSNKDRLTNGVGGFLTMSTLAASSLSLRKLGQSKAVCESDFARFALNNPMSTGVLSAIPTGIVGGEFEALRQGKWHASLKETGQSIYGMAFVGLALGGAHYLKERRPTSTRTDFEFLTADQMLHPDAGFRGKGAVGQGAFRPMSEFQFNESRQKSIEDLKTHTAFVGPDGKISTIYDQLMNESSMTDAQKHQTLDILSETREHFMELSVDSKLPDQGTGWIQTQRKLSSVLDIATANELSGVETQDALIASMFYDCGSHDRSATADNNFHRDMTLAASEALTRRSFAPERIDSVVNAIREQVARISEQQLDLTKSSETQSKVSRALTDGDPISRYATSDGIGAIVRVRGPETVFKDSTVWDSIRSGDTTLKDAYETLTPEGKRMAESKLFELNQHIFGESGKFNDYRNLPPAQTDLSLEARMYRWMKFLDKSPQDGIPFFNESLKYPKEGLGPEVNQEITTLREKLSDTTLTTEHRAQLDRKLSDISGLDGRQWEDFDFAKQIRDSVTYELFAQSRIDGTAPDSFRSVREPKPEVLNERQRFARQFANPTYDPLSTTAQKMDIPVGGGERLIVSGLDKSSTVFDDSLGTQLRYNAGGQLEYAKSDSRTNEYRYDANKQLDWVKLSDSQQIYRAENGQWLVRETAADGKVRDRHWHDGPIVVDGDGTLRYIKANGRSAKEVMLNGSLVESTRSSRTLHRTDGTKSFYGVDGASIEFGANGEQVIHCANGRIQYEVANYEKELTRLHELVDEQFCEPQRQERFRNLISEFEIAAQARGLSENHVALQYQQMNRLMQDNPRALLSTMSRLDLAEQVLNHAAYPETVYQGQNPTCNPSSFENRLYYRHPDKVAQLVADIAITGKYTMKSGQVVDLFGINGGISPDAEAQMNLDLQRTGGDLIKRDGSRDWATKLTNEVVVNYHYAVDSSTYITEGNRAGTNPLAYNHEGVPIGIIRDADVSAIFDKKGNPVRANPGDKLYNYNGVEIFPEPQKLVRNEKGEIRGLIHDASKINRLFDNNGQSISQLEPGQHAFDENGKLFLSRVRPGQITFLKGKPGHPFDNGGLIYNGDSPLLTAEGKFGSPIMTTRYLSKINTEIYGYEEMPFCIERSHERASLANVETISSAAELGSLLEQMGPRDLPAVVLVHTSGRHFNASRWRRALGLGGGWHNVSISDYDPANRMVKFANSWGAKFDRLTEPVPLKDMFRSMQPSSPIARSAWKMWASFK
ncbi:hypothetical protein BH10CYA1_BH10CYA1_14310 [soil metagenome]